jgi:hypothetical protein
MNGRLFILMASFISLTSKLSRGTIRSKPLLEMEKKAKEKFAKTGNIKG